MLNSGGGLAAGNLGTLSSGRTSMPETGKASEADMNEAEQQPQSPIEQLASETGQSPLVLMVQARAAEILQSAAAAMPEQGPTYGPNAEPGPSMEGIGGLLDQFA